MRVVKGSSCEHIDFLTEQHVACSLDIGSNGNGLRQNCAIGRIERSADHSAKAERSSTNASSATSKRNGQMLTVDLN